MKKLSKNMDELSGKKSFKSSMLLGVSILALGSTVQNVTMFAASVAGLSIVSSAAYADPAGGGGGTSFGGGGDVGDPGHGGDGSDPVAPDLCDGTESRVIKCRDFRGNVVTDSFCDRVGMKPVGSRLCEADCPTTTNEGDGDPLVFDLDGNGVSLVSAADGVMFDIDNDGEPNQTGWVDGSDGLLTIDKNGNGIIDNQSELFGTDKTGAYNNLAEYDSNDDGVIDKDDPVWKHLEMWIDKNSNGKTDKHELKSMEQLKMTEIDLNYKTVDQINAGNKVTGVGTFTRWVKGAGEVVSRVIEAFFDFIA